MCLALYILLIIAIINIPKTNDKLLPLLYIQVDSIEESQEELLTEVNYTTDMEENVQAQSTNEGKVRREDNYHKEVMVTKTPDKLIKKNEKKKPTIREKLKKKPDKNILKKKEEKKKVRKENTSLHKAQDAQPATIKRAKSELREPTPSIPIKKSRRPSNNSNLGNDPGADAQDIYKSL